MRSQILKNQKTKYMSHYELFYLDQAELRVPARDQRLQLSK